MNISIFGLGYVGAVTAGCLASRGHSIVGVDVHPQKVADLNDGVPPIIEPGLDVLLREAKANGQLRATQDSTEAVAATNASIICVGTPSMDTGALDLSYVHQVMKQLADAFRANPKPHALILRSTMLPGSTAALVAEHLSDVEGADGVSIYYDPEFLRESTAVDDFENPSLSVVGTRDAAAPPDAMFEVLSEGTEVVTWNTAEMIKYACNAFHAAKITFANEVGRVAKAMDIDARMVMELLCRDTKLNLSPYYMKPGNPFGGSCLPKDVRALTSRSRQLGLNLPLMENLLPSNEKHLQHLLSAITETGQKEVVILGLSFKSNTDDLRESAMVEVAQTLLGRGYQLRIYDPALHLASLVGSNKRLIDIKMPHLASLLHAELPAALGERGLILAAQKCVAVDELARHIKSGHQILDVNSWPALQNLGIPYQGFCW